MIEDQKAKKPILANMDNVRAGGSYNAEEILQAKGAKDIVMAASASLLATATISTLEHMQSDDGKERALGQKQLHSLLPFIMPKQSELTLKSEGQVTEDVASAIKKALNKE